MKPEPSNLLAALLMALTVTTAEAARSPNVLIVINDAYDCVGVITRHDITTHRCRAVLAALTPPVRLEFVVDEIVRVHVTEQHDITSATTIATIGPAPRLIFFAAEADTAPPTVTSRQFH